MLISRELREKNIAEYLLYMWQVEDMIRAAQFDEGRLFSVVLASDQPEEVKKEWCQWYSDLIAMMTTEGVREKGHLQINNNILILLEDLHARLMASSKCPEYHEAYYRVLPVIVEFRQKGGQVSKNELENCFDLLYGVWMLRLRRAEVSAGTADAAAQVSSFLARLAELYGKDRAGQLVLNDED